MFAAIFFFFISAHSIAQKDSIQFLLIDTITNGAADYYMAGNFNSWNPKDEKYRFKKDNGGNFVLYKIFDKSSNLEFKFTKGNWQTVECDNNGNDIENRYLKTDTTTFAVYTISGWKDKFKPQEKRHTASNHVSIIDTAFYIPQLNRYRRIWVYLPEGYGASSKRYPVMYLHDGQNVFDEYTSGFGEWGVDECLDTLIAKGKPPCIIVAIDNDGLKRMGEYNPYEFELNMSGRQKQKFTAEGDLYIRFITQTLKPFIDKNYKTIPSKENTMIAGSSMGGLISYYAAVKYPDIFGKVGVFSPAFWTAQGINALTDSVSSKLNSKFFFYMGALEGGKYLDDMRTIVEKLGTFSNTMIYTIIDEQGRHNEAAWRKWFAEFYNWIIADGYNSIIKLTE